MPPAAEEGEHSLVEVGEQILPEVEERSLVVEEHLLHMGVAGLPSCCY